MEPEDGGVWDDLYPDPKVVADTSTVDHRLKHGRLEDGCYNKVCTVVYLLLLLCFESITKQPSFCPSFLLLTSGGKLLLTLGSGSLLMKAKWVAGIIV